MQQLPVLLLSASTQGDPGQYCKLSKKYVGVLHKSVPLNGINVLHASHGDVITLAKKSARMACYNIVSSNWWIWAQWLYKN